MNLRGLTLWRPWAAAIVHGPKRVENRTWQPLRALVDTGLTIAIHAGKRWDSDAIGLLRTAWPECARILDADGSRIEEWPKWWNQITAEGIVGVARFRFACPVVPAIVWGAGEWAFGPWCWMLEDVRALAEPIPCRGAQGLWRLPIEIETYLRTLLA